MTIFKQKEENRTEELAAVKHNALIAWIKSVGECESFLMMSMYQQHVLLTKARSAVLQAFLWEEKFDLDTLKPHYEYLDNLIIDLEDRMVELKDKCQP
jgi:hypothetical protein